MVYCKSKQLRPKTMNSYEQALRLFERWCADNLYITDVDKVSEQVIRRYINDLMERGKYTIYRDDAARGLNCPERRRDYRQPVSATTINNYIRNLRVFFNWLDEQYLIQKNPMGRIKLLRAERKAKEFLTDEEYKRLTGQLDKSHFSEHRDYAIIVLLLDSGMRLGECVCLTVSDVDLMNRAITLRAENTKGRRERTVFFSDWTANVLRRWLQFKDRYAESMYLFPVKETGEPVEVRGFEANFRRYVERARINHDVTPHCLRNNFAKRCLMNGMDIYTLSRLLGHSSVTVTERAYLDLTDEDIGRRYKQFSPVGNMR